MSPKVKSPTIRVGEESYVRIPIKTHVVMREDKLLEVVQNYAAPMLQPGDLLFVTEKIVAITQGRAIPLEEIKPRGLARFLSGLVTKTPAGIGLGMPETMEMAIREVGTLRILYATLMSALTKPFGKKGVFYDVAGYKAKSIDGPTPNTLPPYNRYVVLGPERPNEAAREICESLSSRLGAQADGLRVAIVDINDLEGSILGISHDDMDPDRIARILKDNPLGQDHEQTPLGIIRRTEDEA